MIEFLTLTFVIVYNNLENIFMQQVIRCPTPMDISVLVQAFADKINKKQIDYSNPSHAECIGYVDYELKTMLNSFTERLTFNYYIMKNRQLIVTGNANYVLPIIEKITEEYKNIELLDQEVREKNPAKEDW